MWVAEKALVIEVDKESGLISVTDNKLVIERRGMSLYYL